MLCQYNMMTFAILSRVAGTPFSDGTELTTSVLSGGSAHVLLGFMLNRILHILGLPTSGKNC